MNRVRFCSGFNVCINSGFALNALVKLYPSHLKTSHSKSLLPGLSFKCNYINLTSSPHTSYANKYLTNLLNVFPHAVFGERPYSIQCVYYVVQTI